MSQQYTTNQKNISNSGYVFHVFAEGLEAADAVEHSGIEIVIADPLGRSFDTSMVIENTEHRLRPEKALIFNSRLMHQEKFLAKKQSFLAIVLKENLILDVIGHSADAVNFNYKASSDADLYARLLSLNHILSTEEGFDESFKVGALEAHAADLITTTNCEYGNRLNLSGPKGTGAIYAARECARIMVKNFTDCEFGLESLSQELGLTKFHVIRVFKKNYGLTPHQFLLNLRLGFAQNFLLNSDKTILDISMDCGFSDLRNFNKLFAKRTGQPPSSYRLKKPA